MMQGHVNEPPGFAFMICHRKPERNSGFRDDTRNFREEPAMTFCNLLTHSRRFIAYALFAVLLVSNAPQASANDHSLHSGHEAMSMAMHEETQVDASQQSKLLADKKESEFNHHLAGFFVILAGLFILAEGTLSQRGSFLFSTFRAVPARLQRHRAVALRSPELVVRSHPQSRRFAAQDVCRNSACSGHLRGSTRSGHV